MHFILKDMQWYIPMTSSNKFRELYQERKQKVRAVAYFCLTPLHVEIEVTFSLLIKITF